MDSRYKLVNTSEFTSLRCKRSMAILNVCKVFTERARDQACPPAAAKVFFDLRREWIARASR